LSPITSDILIIAMFLIVDLETVSNTEFIGMVIIYFSAMFQMCNSSCSLVVAIIPEGKYIVTIL
jgi:hypothetical protein